MDARRDKGSFGRLVRGTAVLGAAAIITKIIGLIYKIPLIGFVGIEGMAYFLAANHIYVFLFVISTSGLPVAVSILVSQAEERGDRTGPQAVFRTALLMFFVVGTAGMLIMLFSCGAIAEIINIRGSALSIAAVSPAILMACIGAAYRGYFQGLNRMEYTAVSQIIESGGKLFLGLAGAAVALALGLGTTAAAALAILGITAGVAISALYLSVSKFIYDKKRGNHKVKAKEARSGTTAKQLIKIALPITLSSAVVSLTGLIDTALIANCLGAAGFSESMINRMYSCYGNISVPLFNLTPSLITPVAMAAVPLISAASGTGDEREVKKVAEAAIRITFLAAIPAAAGLSVFSTQTIRLIFPSQHEASQIAGPLLSLLALAIIPVCITTTSNAVLQARGKAGLTIVSMIAGAVVKIILEILLVRIPVINITGAPISTFMSSLTIAALNTYFMLKYVPGLKVLNRAFLTTAMSAVLAVTGAALVWRLTYEIDSHALRYFTALATAPLLYAIAAFLTGSIDTGLFKTFRSSTSKQNQEKNSDTHKISAAERHLGI